MNDVAVTRDAVYVTDSGSPQLVVIPLGAHGSLPPPSAATLLPVGGEMIQAPGINLNGIVAENGVLLVANSTTGSSSGSIRRTVSPTSSTSAEQTSATRTGSNCSGRSSTWSAPSTTGSRGHGSEHDSPVASSSAT